ncbi:IS4 family transposase [Ktedonobacter racemifer]|uniref:Transposase IS4 family protein n=1 Tax=Ktedonobacter racemifer DSM 44963 TaxID=485913 RepID=D6TDZ2_KTERA|nr:IS4 family transposase [Ktedonobacter racemifer]EFH80062.1 transposase IS4 family protein [Ktedonobacter racemifer DSM 44963]EFH82592.1 transposase IS4 family protein [Ktedonobacter racemifer DSM 44963]EFH88365.1 transposase IS4 family protein [Ktedonobacter racemifer DSM 44963]
MKTQEILDPEQWAEATFGQTQLKDMRRTRRAVTTAAHMAEEPAASLPAQAQTWKDAKAVYRLLDEPNVTFDALMQPHWQQTRLRMDTLPLVLLVQDTTDLDLSHRRKMSGLGEIGNGNGRGMYLQTVLAVEPDSRAVLGCAYQCPFIRIPAPKGETRAQRCRREKETDIWHQCVQHIGPSPASSVRVQVADRGADIFEFLHVCRSIDTHFVVRATQDRRVQTQEGTLGYLFEQVRSQPSSDVRPFDLPARHGHQARSTTLYLSWTSLELLPPRNDSRLNKLPPLPVWVIRVWEEGAPKGEEPLEWILLTSLVGTTCEQAWQRVEWYRARWRVEDYHHCLKTGCRIEERQVQSAERLIRLLGMLSPLAVRLLQVRDLSRQAPESPAHEVIEPETLTILAAHVGLLPSTMTVETFWTEIARMGGFLARRGDGPPGWKTLWKGWLHLQALLEGAHLAFHLRL